MSWDATAALRLLLAAVLGGLVGFERQRRHHPAGLRTHTLVCLGSALIMLVSEDIAARYLDRTNADPARIAAQVVSGIGFLGAGTIMREGLTVRGLTTAASLWVVAALGLAVGAGYYLAAGVTVAVALVTLGVLNRLELLVAERGHNARVRVTGANRPGLLADLTAELDRLRVHARSFRVHEAGDSLRVEVTGYCPPGLGVDTVMERLLTLEGVRHVECELS